MGVQHILSVGSIPDFTTIGKVHECGRIKRWIMDDEGKSAHQLRHEIMPPFGSLEFLSQDQLFFLELLVGELAYNACKCSSGRIPVDIAWKEFSSAVQIRIVNPSDKCLQGNICQPECWEDEHGRGLPTIKDLVDDLNKDGICASCDLCYHDGLFHSHGRMVCCAFVGHR